MRSGGASGSAAPLTSAAPLNWSVHYHARMLSWVLKLEPEAGLALRLAAMAQHLGRYLHPRGDFPEGRAGYLAWRAHAAARQAEAAEDILARLGCPSAVRTRVRSLLLKENLAHDAEVQTLEDAACLVFFELELEALSHKHDQAKLERVLRKTWKKMSGRGRREAQSIAVVRSPEISRVLRNCPVAEESFDV